MFIKHLEYYLDIGNKNASYKNLGTQMTFSDSLNYMALIYLNKTKSAD